MGLEIKMIWFNWRDELEKTGFHSTKGSLQHSETNKQLYNDWTGNSFLHPIVPQNSSSVYSRSEDGYESIRSSYYEKEIIILGKKYYDIRFI